jgi:hypothetical protein
MRFRHGLSTTLKRFKNIHSNTAGEALKNSQNYVEIQNVAFLPQFGSVSIGE